MKSSSDRVAPAASDVPGGAPAPKLLDRLRDHLRTRHYSIRTETAYVDWARRFILFHGKRHPQEMGAAEVEAFLTHLAVQRQVSASTQNQAKAAILYLYKQVLGVADWGLAAQPAPDFEVDQRISCQRVIKYHTEI